MKRAVVGVVGHVDHGKTALVRALTGQETDRLAEEQRRGISIALGFAFIAGEDGAIVDLVDMPGHERFVRTMIAGATGIDAILLVVAANEGIKPQTVEHVEIAGLLGIGRALVVVTKCDLVAADETSAVADAAVDLLAARGMVVEPPIFACAPEGQGVDALRDALLGLAAVQAPRPSDGIAYLPVDRAFSVPGHGPVVTGTLRGAAIAAGDVLHLLPGEREVRVRSVQVHGVRVGSALPGQRAALNLRGVDIADLARGMAVAAPGALVASTWLTLAIRAVEGAPPLKNGIAVRALFGTAEVDARLRLLDHDVLGPGGSGFAQLHLAEPAALPAGEHVILRLPAPVGTLAGGRVIEPEARRRRRHCPQVLERLRDLAELPPAERMMAEIAREGRSGIPLARLARLAGLGTARAIELLSRQPVVLTRDAAVIGRDQMDALLARIPPLLALNPAGLPLGRLREALGGVGAAVLDEALARLLASGAVAKRGPAYVVPHLAEDRRRAEGEEELADRIAGLLRSAGLSPPTPKEILVDHHARRAVDRLLRDGTLIRAVDRAKHKEILFHRDAVAEARRRLDPLLGAGPGLLVSEIAAALGVSRKYTMPLLDHLDATRFTERVGDRRIRGKSR